MRSMGGQFGTQGPILMLDLWDFTHALVRCAFTISVAIRHSHVRHSTAYHVIHSFTRYMVTIYVVCRDDRQFDADLIEGVMSHWGIAQELMLDRRCFGGYMKLPIWQWRRPRVSASCPLVLVKHSATELRITLTSIVLIFTLSTSRLNAAFWLTPPRALRSPSTT